MSWTIRRARVGDAAVLTAVAHRAKRHWGYPDELIALWRADLSVSEQLIVEHDVYCADDGGAVLGFYCVIADGAGLDLAHMWVDPPQIGHGVGRALFAHAVVTSRGRGASTLTIASDPYAEGFYVRMGARRVGDIAAPPLGRRLPVLAFDLASSPVP